MPQYKLKSPKKMGERHAEYGQTWWSDTPDSPKPLMFNLMSGEVGDGAVIEFEESVNKTSAKGTEYLRLRKVKINSAGDTSSPSSPPNDTVKLLELIYDDTQAILKLVSPLIEIPDEVADVPDGEISMDDIGF